MKNSKRHIILLYLIIIVLIGINIISNKDIILDKNTITLKDMNESTQIADKEKTIDDLNISYSEYQKSIQESKQKLAKAINMYPNNSATEQNSLDELSTMINNLTDIPKSTYYYVEGTEGSNTIERYKYINGNYYLCNENGTVADGTSSTDVSSKTLIEYVSSNTGNLSAGTASYINKSLLLGDGSDNYTYSEKFDKTPITIKSSMTLANKSTINPYTDTITFTKPKGYTTIELSCKNSSGSGTKKAYLKDSDGNTLASVTAGNKTTYSVAVDECTLILYTYAKADTDTYGCHCYGQVVLK